MNYYLLPHYVNGDNLKFYIYSESLPDNIPTPVIAGIRLPLATIELPPKPITPSELSIKFKISNNVYSFSPIIQNFLEPALDKLYDDFMKKYYNSRMLRFKKYDGFYHTEIVYYFHHRVIHHDADTMIYKGQTIRDALEDILMDEITTNEESIFPNGTGANVLMITSDNYIIIPKRSKNVSIARNKYAPSLSFGMLHAKTSNIIWWNIEKALLREYNYIPNSSTETYFLGSFRNLFTMGSPELYFVMKLTEGIDEFEAKISDENKKIEAIEVENIIDDAEALAYELDPDQTSEHVYAILFLIDFYKKALGKVL